MKRDLKGFTGMLVLAVISAVTLSGCAASYREEGAISPPLRLEGRYHGTYWRTEHDGTNEQVRHAGEVWMDFRDGRYRIEGDFRHLPPAGSGRYRIEGDRLILEDTANHTADFDWTLILQGPFEVQTGRGGLIRLEQRDLEHARRHELELRLEE